MKKRFFLLIAFITFFVGNSQNVVIPNANFKALLLSANTTNFIAFDNNSSWNTCVTIDTNHDGEIQVSEASLIVRLDISYSGLTDISGIQSFTNLTTLSCSNNQISNLNLIGLNYLNNLFCQNNQISNLNIASQNLSWLVCRNNQLQNINFSSLPYLSQLDCSFNLLSSLNFTNNPQLDYLDCQNNQLSSLILSSNLTSLDCSNNQLTSLDITLSDFGYDDVIGSCNFSNNPIVNLIANNQALYYGGFMFANTPSLQQICCQNINYSNFQSLVTQYGYANCFVNTSCNLSNQQSEFSSLIILYPNPSSNILNIKVDDNALVSKSIYNVIGQLVLEILNSDESIDVSSLTSGNYLIKVVYDSGIEYAKFVKK